MAKKLGKILLGMGDDEKMECNATIDGEEIVFTRDDGVIRIPLDDRTREMLKNIYKIDRDKATKTVEKNTEENAKFNEKACMYYLGVPRADNVDASRIYLPPKNAEILFEMLKILRNKEAAFVYGVFCPDCGTPVFGGKGGCPKCNRDLSNIETVCPHPGCRQTVGWGETCPACHKDTNLERYANIGDMGYFKTKLAAVLKLNRPFHFFTGFARLRHLTADKERADLSSADGRVAWGVDFTSDVDAKTIEEAKAETTKLIKYYKKEGIKPRIIFSGSKGFHTHIPFEDLVSKMGVKKKDTYTAKEVTDIITRIRDEILEKSGAKADPQVGSSERQLIRLGFSYHYKSGFVALPLTKKQFDNFDLEMVKPENVFKTAIRDRGLPKYE